MVGIVAVVIAVLVAAGPERHGIAMADAHRIDGGHSKMPAAPGAP